MADPTLVLLIVVGTSPGDRLRGGLVSNAITDGLGRDAHVLVEERASEPPDAEAAGVLERVHASAVAEIAWADAAHARAHLHVYLASDRTWYDRDLSFDASDAADERERAVGLLVGAMIRATEPEAPAARPAAPPPQPVPIVESVANPRPPESPNRPRQSRFATDVGALITAGIGGDASAVGPSLRGHFIIAPFSVHVSGSLGFGSIDSADASTSTTRLAAGGRWCFLTVVRDLSFDVGVEALAIRHVVRRADPSADRDRWLWGGHADVGIGWRLGRVVEPFATGGVDAVLGNTPITVAGRTVAQIPPFRAVGEAGLRVHF